MAEYIEREALEIDLNHRLNFLMEENGVYDHYTSGFDEAVTMVENFSSADVAPVRYGRWKSEGMGDFRCSICSYIGSAAILNNYCPNCGAKMDLEGDNEN